MRYKDPGYNRILAGYYYDLIFNGIPKYDNYTEHVQTENVESIMKYTA